MAFEDYYKNILENYLTDYSKHSAPTTTPQNQTNNSGSGNNNTQGGDNILSSLIMRAADSDDGLDGVDELDEYLTSLNIDKTKLNPLLGELTKRFNSNGTKI